MIKLQRIFFGAGAALLLAAASLLVYSLVDDYLAGERARKLLEETLLPAPLSAPAAPVAPAGDTPAAEDMAAEEAVPLDVIGVVRVPRFGIELPVLGEYTPEQLDITVCRYIGELGEPGEPPERLVLAGHNYKSHFKPVTGLEAGDAVTFTTMDNEEYAYAVTGLEAVTGDDVVGVATGDWDLTLLTCNKDLTLRVLVRCKLAEEAA